MVHFREAKEQFVSQGVNLSNIVISEKGKIIWTWSVIPYHVFSRIFK